MEKVAFAVAGLTRRRCTQKGLALAEEQHGGQAEDRAGELMRLNRELQQEITERKWAEDNLLIYHEKLRCLTSELALAEERERRRIALEVHDHIGQNLAFAKMSLATIKSATSSGEAAEAVGEVIKLIDETIQDTRQLISEIASPVLYELGLVPAVELLTQQTQKRHGIAVSVSDDGMSKPLSDDLRVLLYRAVRELLINTVKHAQAGRAKVSITKDRDQICIKVEDDGRGFDTEETASSAVKTGCYGLFSIKERLQPLGGYLNVDSRPGHGTRVTLAAPLTHHGQGTGAQGPWS
ncbi:MAG: sensor histidine kinase [Thermodesulfobacteriota bacterium]|nr:sensor histidine kinase [Thermodesulfobacteriota bacterium]